MIDEAEGDCWVSRRNGRIRRPISSVGVTSDQNIPYLAPEIQLFYKARDPRTKDVLDFEAVWPILSPWQRWWLADAVSMAYGMTSPWYDRLSATE